MVQEKSFSVRRFLSYGVKPYRFSVYNRTIFLISEIRFTYKFVILDIKTKQNIFFDFFVKPKCMLKCIYKYFFEVFFVIKKKIQNEFF
jgi:hypothetical protein